MEPHSSYFQILPIEHSRVSNREYFRNSLDQTLDALFGLEMRMGAMSNGIPREFRWMEYDVGRKKIESDKDIHLDGLFPVEQTLFQSLFQLFEIKHGIGEENQNRSSRFDGPFNGKSIVFLGGLASGKTTITKALAKSLNIQFIVEPFVQNPFWSDSESLSKQHGYNPILQSQMFFVLQTILSNIDMRLQEGISLSDTSLYNDAFLWADWYHKTGHMSDKEYKAYQKLAQLFAPIFAKPDLLVCVIAQDPQELFKGKTLRGRKSEQGFTLEDLIIQNERAQELANSLGLLFDIQVLPLVVSPLQMYKDGKPNLEEVNRYTQVILKELNR